MPDGAGDPEQRPIRDAIAIAERPDGSRVAFRPYPTPLFDEDGELTGAVNMLIDVTEEQSEALHEQAERCRRLADALYSRESSERARAIWPSGSSRPRRPKPQRAGLEQLQRRP